MTEHPEPLSTGTIEDTVRNLLAKVAARDAEIAALRAVLRELSEASWKVLVKYEWNGWGVTSPNGYDEALLADRTAKARAALSGPAETPEHPRQEGTHG